MSQYKYDISKIDAISISQVAEDWGIELFPCGNNSYTIYCPNPYHEDRNLGNCKITETDEKNFFYCFACGEGGGPISLVMLVENCEFLQATKKLATRYGISAEKNTGPKWEGLTTKEYALFGLKNVRIRSCIDGDEDGAVTVASERFTLRDLAKENPELHDEMLIGKFWEMVDRTMDFAVSLQKKVYFYYSEQYVYNKHWEGFIENHLLTLKKLLHKGLVDKRKFDMIFTPKEVRLQQAREKAKSILTKIS